MKKKNPMYLICMIASVLLAGCGILFKSEYTVGKDIRTEDISEFYYTLSNINYNAFYQRYHFYAENGRWMLSHETRQRVNEYGPTTEEDITMSGTFELSESERDEFFGFLEGGEVTKRKESAAAGSSGPWLYLYWKDDRSLYQVFAFSSYATLKSFEEFCSALVAGH